MIKFTQLLFGLLCCSTFLTSFETFGQSLEGGWGVPKLPENCEMNLQNIEYLANLFKSESADAGFIIVVARLGQNERFSRLNQRRLYNVGRKLTLIEVPRNRIILTEAEPIKGFGRVEFYWKGKFAGALLVDKGRDLCVTCCGPDDRFYPHNKRPKRSKND